MPGTQAHTHDGQRQVLIYRPDIRAQLAERLTNAKQHFTNGSIVSSATRRFLQLSTGGQSLICLALPPSEAGPPLSPISNRTGGNAQMRFERVKQLWPLPGRPHKVEWHQGELYPRVGFIVTNLRRPDERVVKFYNGRGTAEQWIREGKNALRWTRLSCHAFRHNAVRLQLHALAYNLANFLRTLALPEEVEQWSLTTLRDKLVKIGARIVRHGRYVVFQLAEVAVPRSAVRRDPAPDRPAQAKAAPDMTRGVQGGSNPTGEVRPRSHKCAPNQARSRLALPRERCGAPSAAFTGLRALPHPPNRRILAMERAHLGKFGLCGRRNSSAAGEQGCSLRSRNRYAAICDFARRRADGDRGLSPLHAPGTPGAHQDARPPRRKIA